MATGTGERHTLIIPILPFISKMISVYLCEDILDGRSDREEKLLVGVQPLKLNNIQAKTTIPASSY
jgi:hypothetical protein